MPSEVTRAGPPSARLDYPAAPDDLGLAKRISHLLPQLPAVECGSGAAQIHAGLTALLRREAAPDESGDLAGVAKGLEELLPILTDADLLLLLASALATLSPATPSPASHTDRPITQALLANSSIRVREAMLDTIAGSRRELGRTALSREASQSIRAIAASHSSASVPPGFPSTGAENMFANIRALKNHDALTEATLLEAARLEQPDRVAMILAIASGTSLDAVDHAARLRAAKALVALAWKSGFTMRAAIAAQTLLGQLGPNQLLQPTADGGFPLTRAEMEWQIELLSAPNPAEAPA